MKAVDELAEAIRKDWDDAVQERTKADTQDGYYYAEGKARVSKTHWHKVVEVQKQIQDLEAHIEERIKAYISIEEFVASTALESILQKIRGEK